MSKPLLRIRRLLYGWRFTNWLIAKPWPRRNGWRYRTVYRMVKEGSDGVGINGKFYPSMVRPPTTRREAAWAALTFPHVHGEWED